MKSVWKAGMEVPAFARRVVNVFVAVMQRARTCLYNISISHVREYYKDGLPKKQHKPEVSGRQIRPPLFLLRLQGLDRLFQDNFVD